MIPNNNLSVLPWYSSIEQQNARKWWVYGRVYPLFTPAGFFPPFQILREHSNYTTLQDFRIYTKDGALVGNYTSQVAPYISVKAFTQFGYDVIVCAGSLPIFPEFANGQYYARLRMGGVYWYSEVFTVVNDVEPYLKITWWDKEDFVMDAGTIVYTDPAYKNVLYLDATLAKPQYNFEEEAETRDGYLFPIKQISAKIYKFKFLASEYLLDVMRFIRLSDFVTIEYHGQSYTPDTFLITPEWENSGDVAAVEAEFGTATVAKKIGAGYISTQRGDFNNDFNNDFDNQQ